MLFHPATTRGGYALLLVILWSGFGASAFGQDYRYRGLPVISQHYAPGDYDGTGQNWSIAQDSAGVVFVGNTKGILEFDGSTWRLWPSSNHSTARSLALGADGRIYAGFVGDFGYLDLQDDGSREFISLLDKLEPADQQFDDVWGTHSAGQNIYFQTRDRVFRWDGESFKIFNATGAFRTSFSVHGHYYVRDQDAGLLRAEGDTLVMAPGGEFFQGRQIYVMAPFGRNHVLIGTRSDGLFLYDGKSVEAFRTEVDAWLTENRLYSGTTIDGEYAVFGTLGGGIAMIDLEGRLLHVMDERSGLADGWINFAFADRDGGVWLAHHNRGIAYLDLPSSLTVFDERHQLRVGIITGLTKREDRLFVASSAGLSYADLNVAHQEGAARFQHLNERRSVFVLKKKPSGILIGTSAGVHLVDDEGNELARAALGEVKDIAELDDSTMIAATPSGVMKLTSVDDQLIVEPIRGADEGVHWVTPDRFGSIWVITRSRDLVRYVPEPDDEEAYRAERFTEELGVPSDAYALTIVDGDVVLVTRIGVWRFDKDGGRFVRDEAFDFLRGEDHGNIRSFAQDQLGRVWVVRERRVDILTKNGDGTYDVNSPPALSAPEWTNVYVHVEDDGTAWLSNDQAIYYFDPEVGAAKTYDADLPPLIREVTLVDTGERLSAKIFPAGVRSGFQELPHRQNAVRFDVALPSFNEPGSNKYQFYLEGHDRGWSPWSPIAHKNYTNLFEGTYRLRVRGMNAHGAISPETVYTFRILPPWYRTVWAYGVYGVLLIILGIFIHHYRRMAQAHRRATEQEAALEQERLVNERLQESYRKLQQANESLLQADKLKDEFLASTSHELRTPLTAILGFASILKEEVQGEHREFLGMIEENGKRLLHTLNSLLDLAKLRVGMMDIDLQPVDITRCAHDVGKLLMPLASKKGLELDVRTPSSALFSMLDRHCAERVFYNLIGNAIKFTDEGRVAVVVSEEGSDVKVTISDTGIGIEEQFIPHLFDEFKQESSGNTREHEGSGLGLAITNRLVQIMKGSIVVSSAKGEGSIFTVTFPKYHTVKRAMEAEREVAVDPEHAVN